MKKKGKKKSRRKILIAAAWPYANGSLHLGHVVGLIGSDILARFFRLKGEEVLFVSGSDCHGTPIVFEAEKQGVEPAEIAQKYHQEFKKTLINGLSFSYDNYSKTTSKIHQETVQEIFLKLFHKGHIYKKNQTLPYCENCQRFLPDRYIEGECPICHFNSARGDQCDNCGNLLDAGQLVRSRCKICGTAPIWKKSEHFFLKLAGLEKELKRWIKQSSGWRSNAKNFTLKLLEKGLKDRAITRDTLWGVPIPLKNYENKRIYVWFEAVCGYISASREWAKKKGKVEKWKDFWENKKALHYYVHGKDNIPFHTIIWPAILLGAGNYHLPDRIISSEYLTLEGKQFSKSRHWAVWLPGFLKNFDGDLARYFLIINGAETADADFSWKEFEIKINNELIGNFGNFIFRVLSFIERNFKEGLKFPTKTSSKQEQFLKLTKKTFFLLENLIEKGEFKKALKEVFKVVEFGNRYLEKTAPWETIKTNPLKTEADLAIAAFAIKSLAILIEPFLPQTSQKICQFVGLDFNKLSWQFPKKEFLKVNLPQHLFKKIEKEEIEKQLELLKK